MTYIAYFDGACEPVNPGGTASYGAVIIEDDETIWGCSEIYGQGKLMSKNVAEYAGFIAVLEWFIEQELCDAEIVVKGDSMLVMNQMFGTWKIKNGLYAPLAKKASELRSRFIDIKGEWIPRDLNDVADELSKAALKKAGVKLRLQPA